MTESTSALPIQSRNPLIAGGLSLIIPGTGQILVNRVWRGITILLTVPVLAYLIFWGFDNFAIGQIQIGGSITSWLWIPLVLFWAWNAFDAYLYADGRQPITSIGLLLSALILFYLAFSVTDVKFDRLISRFNDATKVANSLIHPDLITLEVNGEPQPCNWGCFVGYLQGHDINTVLRPSDNFGAIFGKLSDQPANAILVRLGIAHADQMVSTFTPGTLVETIAIGLLATIFSTLFAVPVSFFAAHNIMLPLRQTIGNFAKWVIAILLGLKVLLLTKDDFSGLIFPPGSVAPPEIVILFIGILLGIVGMFIGGWVLGLIQGRLGQSARTILNGVFMSLALFVIGSLFGFLGGVLGLILGLVSGILWGERYFPFGTAVYYGTRTLLNIVRAVDTVIWGLLLIVWLGLGNLAAITALTIHSVAALAKLYSEELEHIDMGTVEAVTATGSNLLQVIRYAIIPQIVPPFLTYTLLRWDINMRAATIVGFVAGGGIGFFVLETIRKGAYEQYAAALWAIAIVIIIVDQISSVLSERIRRGESKVEEQAPIPFWKSPLKIGYSVLGLGLFIFCWNVSKIDLRFMFEPAPTFGPMLQAFVSIDTTPILVDAVVRQLIITVFQALLATTFGALLAIPFSFLAAHNLTGRSRLSAWICYITRGAFDILRSIEALLYVAIFVVWVGIGTFAGTLALAITTFGLIGKLYADSIENIDLGPMEAITATGANRLQAIIYAILPQIIPPFVSYSIYQWDINVRMATIIGFAGGGGVGLLLNTYFGQLQYHKAGTVVLLIVIVVAMMDFASAKIREQMV